MVQLHNEQKQVRGTAGGREASPQQHLQFKASPALHDNNYDFRAEPVHVPYLSLYVVRARVCSPLASPGRAAPKGMVGTGREERNWCCLLISFITS